MLDRLLDHLLATAYRLCVWLAWLRITNGQSLASGAAGIGQYPTINDYRRLCVRHLAAVVRLIRSLPEAG